MKKNIVGAFSFRTDSIFEKCAACMNPLSLGRSLSLGKTVRYSVLILDSFNITNVTATKLLIQESQKESLSLQLSW